MPERIDVVGIVTRDRVTGMVVCLESYVENCQRFGRHPEFVVVDDSRDASVQTAARGALQRTARQTNAAIRYAAEPEKNRFAQRLAAESSVPPDVIHFALFGDAHCATTVGANRNALLLDTTGELVFSADDDTLCRIAATPAADDVLTQFSEYDPTELWFFPHRDAALQSVVFDDLDVLGSHESLLGGAVAVTLHGLAGDSGMASPRYYLTLGGASRERLTSSLETYRSAFRSREVLRAVRHPTISSGSFLMTTFFGFDNRIPLPPFFPVQRNEDGIFGLMLQQCWPDRRIGLLPRVLLHAPATRSYSPIDWNDAVRIRLDEVVIDCLLSRGTAPLVECGAHLRELGSLDLDEFEGYVRIVQQQRLIATVTLLQNGLQTFRGAPDYWSADVRGLIEALIASQTRPDFVVPRELPPETARSTSQTLVERFGELLEAWPEMIAASRRLRDAGVRLSEPLT